MGLGVSYVQLDLAGLPAAARLRVSLVGDAGVAWSLQTLLLSAAAPAEEQEHQTKDGKASVELMVGAHRALVLVVANLGDGQLVPEGGGWKPAGFTYSIERLEPPTIASVEPGTLVAGEVGVVLAVHGKGFPEGQPQVTFSDPAFSVGSAKRLSAELCEVTVSVDGAASAGPVDLELAWGTLVARKVAAITVEEAPPPESEQEAPASGGCAVDPGRGPSPSLFWLLSLAVLLRRRSAR